MRKGFIFGSVVVALLLLSCNNQGKVTNKGKELYRNEYVIEKESVKEFALDDETSDYVGYLQLIDRGQDEVLAFVNSRSNSIYFYNYTTMEYEGKIQYDKEGQNGVSKMQAFLYINKDSIFTYSYNVNILFLTNSEGKVLDKYKLFEMPTDLSQGLLPAPYVQTSTPLRKVGDNIICMGFEPAETSYETETNRPVACILNTISKEVKYAINYPKQYAEYNWGGGFAYRMPYFDVNSRGEVVVSFAAENDILVYSILDESLTGYYAGSYQIDKISSFNFPKDVPIDEAKAKDWYLSNSAYQNIIYDKYRNIYYRIARLPLGDDAVKDVRKKPIKIIILDEHFTYQGEVKLDESKRYNLNNCFASEEGLNIQFFTDDEDKISFYVYSFKEDEK